MELQYGFNTLGLDIFAILYHIWLYHRLGISKKTTLKHIVISFLNFVLLRQIILTSVSMLKFNVENTDKTVAVIIQITFFYTVQEFCMYGIHRFVHWNKFCYRWIHKMHHEVKAECFSTAMYMSPLEIIFHIFPDLMLGPTIWVWGFEFIYKEAFIIWTCLATFYFIWTHSGVKDSPYMPSTEFHWLHHKYYTVNYASWISDSIFNTAIFKDISKDSHASICSDR